MTAAPDMQAAARAIADAVEAAEGRLPPKKRRVIEAAVLCFAEQGFAATSTRAIAARAEVAEATIFRHFPTKKALLLRLVAPVARGLLAPEIAAEARALLATSDDLRGFLRAMMLSRLAFADRYAPLVRIVLQEVLVDAELRAVLAESVGGTILALVGDEVGRLTGAGLMRPVTPERFLRAVMSALMGYYLTRTLVAPGPWDDAAEIDAIIDILWNGLRPVPEAPAGR